MSPHRPSGCDLTPCTVLTPSGPGGTRENLQVPHVQQFCDPSGPSQGLYTVGAQ
jgi:hypothetical protein